MEAKRLRKYSGIALGIVLVTAFVLVQPTMQTTYAQVVGEGAPAFENCSSGTSLQPDDPLSMNTIRNGDIAKTIISENYIFFCITVQGTIDLRVHVNTIAEILENMTSKEIISKTALVITCAKHDARLGGDGTVFGCDWYRPDTDFIPVSNCFDITDNYLTHPNEMNTVNKGKIVKTIIIQKEVIRCDFDDLTDPLDTDTPNDKNVDQYIIEEIWEDLRLAPDETVVKLNTESLRCWTLIRTAFVESCQFSSVPLQEFIPEE